jgi:hypothetical protein
MGREKKMESLSGKRGLIWGGLLILLGAMLLLETFTDLSAWVWIAALAVAGLGVYGVYLTDRSEKALLIPAYVLWAVAGLVALITLRVLQDESIAMYVLCAIALPFIVVYAQNREKWWPLIPAYVLVAVGLMVLLIGYGILDDLLIPAYVMFAVAIPFFVVYGRNPKKWWPLIPGGIMAIIGLSFLLAGNAAQYILPAAVIIVGAWMILRQFTGKEPK